MGYLPQTIVCLLILELTSAVNIDGINPVIYKNGVDATGSLTCRVETPLNVGTLFWIVPGKGVVYSYSRDVGGMPQGTNTTNKYSFTDNEGNGEFTIQILELNRGDTGSYTCQFGSTAEKELIVADPPGAPTIAIIATDGVLVEMERAIFTCSSTGGFPAPNFVWTKNGEVLSGSNVVQDNGGLSTSEVTLDLTYEDSAKELKCVVTNELQESKEAVMALDVQYKPRVTLSVVGRQMAVVERGGVFSLSCNIQSNPPHSSIWWTRNGLRVAGNDETLSQPSGVAEDSVYTCTAENARGNGTNTLDVLVQYAPVVTIEQGTFITKNESQRLVLTCTADGKPDDIRYEWTKDSVFASASAQVDITSVTKEYAGIYTCTAYNTMLGGTKAGSGSQTIEVAVNYAPDVPTVEISPSNPNRIYKAGSTVTFTCSLPAGGEGNPVAVFAWFKNGVDLSNRQRTLVMDRTAYNDSGDYMCSASNMLKSEQSSALSLAFEDVPEFVSSTPLEINMTKGDKNEMLKCEYRGVPQPEVEWYYNGNPIAQYEQYRVETDISSSNLEVYKTTISTVHFDGSSRNSVDEEDTGIYTCKARSNIGYSTTERVFTVNVLFGPEFQGHAKAAADPGSAATLTCEVWGYPAASSITFLKDDQVLSSDDPMTLSNVENIDSSKYIKQKRTITFHIAKESDYTSYNCIATSPSRINQRQLVLQKPSQPDSPTNIVVAENSWNSISLQWTPGFDGGRTQSFIVTVNGDQWETTRNTTLTLNDLYPQTDYLIKVSAKNSLGVSESATVDITTHSIYIPLPQITYDSKDKSLTVKLNSTECCVIITGSANKNENGKILFDGECFLVDKELVIETSPPYYSYYTAKACIVGRENEVCSNSASTTNVIVKEDIVYIIGGVVGSTVLLIIVAAIVAFFIVRRRKRKSGLTTKSISPPISNGHINQVMATDETDMEPPYAMYVPPNNNLNTFNSQHSPTANNTENRESENLDYVYAAVQKKPTSGVKHLNTFNAQQPYAPSAPPYENGYELSRIESPPVESNSDNTDQDTLDELPVFDGDNYQSLVIGRESQPYRRMSNISEGGYSTPDSRAKKVIYEVIV